MKKIKLTQGYFAKIDNEDYDKVMASGPWHIKRSYTSKDIIYAYHSVHPNIKLMMHRLILEPRSDQNVDHINSDGLDNRRKNLRLCTDSQNKCWGKKKSHNTSGFIGVNFHKLSGKWQARVRKDNMRHYLGLYDSPRKAALVRDEAAAELHGEFARLNFPEREAGK